MNGTRVADFVATLADYRIAVTAPDDTVLAPAVLLGLDPEGWGDAGVAAAGSGWRFAGIWGDPFADRVVVRACLEQGGVYLVLETTAPLPDPSLASFSPAFTAASRLERHLRDMLGVGFTGDPDTRRWTRHKGWNDSEFPLRIDYPVGGKSAGRTPGDTDYPFKRIEGSGVYEIPVGPVHAGIIEPGHFRFQAVGEDVLRLEERLGYVHKGIEKIAVGRDAAGLARLAGRVSGDSTVAHAWAACQAMERATGCVPPPRAQELRAIMCERERVANHLGDIGAVCNDVGFAFPHVQCGMLRERWQRRSRAVFGHRLMMDAVVAGGVVADPGQDALDALRGDHDLLRRSLEPVLAVIDDHPSLADRLQDTGVLSEADARALACTGYVGRASGLDHDLRRDSPCAPYDRLDVEVPVETAGDVAARVRVRVREIEVSLALMDRLLATLSDGPVLRDFPAPEPGAAGLGLIEGWRGEILAYLRFGETGRVDRYFPRDPSWFSWPALERLIDGNIVPDFPVCNKSINGSYSGHDL